jgi:proteasome lid subunit RPN8/RPN11
MITLPQQIDHEIRFSCEKLFPEEACGVLMGRVVHGVHYVAHALELHNSSPVHRDERYVITPMQYQYATRVARERRLEMIGFYHSHPNRRSEPSAFDLQNALPESIYLILEVIGGRSAGMTGWILAENRTRFDPKNLEVTT